MITGIITAAREAVIRMVVRGPTGHEVGSDGHVMLTHRFLWYC